MEHPGFPRRAPTAKVEMPTYHYEYFSPKNCMKQTLNRGGGVPGFSPRSANVVFQLEQQIPHIRHLDLFLENIIYILAAHK